MADPKIGTLNEGSLHAELKAHYAEPGDVFEVPYDGFVIDIVRDHGTDDELLVEIQTGSFGAMGRKLDHLLERRRMLLVYPIAVRTVLERPHGSGVRRRASPKRGSLWSLLDELVSIPTMLDHPGLELDVVLVEVTKRQEPDPTARRGRGGWRTLDRRLDRIIETHHFTDMTDIATLAGPRRAAGFTTADLADTAGTTRPIAQKLAYCLAAAGFITQTERTRAGKHYRWVSGVPARGG